MTNEENKEWRWTVQKLDDMAKALLRCFDNKQLQCEIKSSGILITPVNISTTSIQNDLQQKQNAEPQNSVEPLAVQDMDTTPSPCVQEKTSDPIHSATVNESSQIPGLNIDVEQSFLSAVETGNWAEVVSALKIDNAMFLQIIDGGGQPSFQEIFPLLINGSSVTFLIFKLTDGLETLYTVQYQPESGSEGPKAWEDTYTVKDIIFHALSSFVSQEDTFQCKILLVGTHKDELGLGDVSQNPHEDKESYKKDKITTIARQLHGWLCQLKAYKSIEVKNIESLITGVDNNDENDIVSVKKKIEEMISQLDSQDIPAPWLVFDFVLHKYAKQNKLRKVKKADCEKISSICHVKDEVDVVLHYLHSEAGTLLYYSDIPKLNEYVITDFQLIFDSISKIIIQYFDDNSAGPHLTDKNLFKQKGQINASVLRNVSGCLEKDELVSLLQHRHIISKIETTNTNASKMEKTNKTMFFMPCVLPKAKLSYDQSRNSSCLLVLFDHGYCPVGLFCAATTTLIVAHKWKVNTGGLQFRNKINFYCTYSEISYNVIFSAFPTHYEICLMGKLVPKVKYMIYKDIDAVFAKVCEDMKYPPPSYGFYCPCANPQYQHPAKCTSQEMICCYSDTPSCLEVEHKQWFSEVWLFIQCITICSYICALLSVNKHCYDSQNVIHVLRFVFLFFYFLLNILILNCELFFGEETVA